MTQAHAGTTPARVSASRVRRRHLALYRTLSFSGANETDLSLWRAEHPGLNESKASAVAPRARRLGRRVGRHASDRRVAPALAGLCGRARQALRVRSGCTRAPGGCAALAPLSV